MKFSDFAKQKLNETFTSHDEELSFFTKHFLRYHQIAEDIGYRLLKGKKFQQKEIVSRFSFISINGFKYEANGSLSVTGLYFDGNSFRSYKYVASFKSGDAGRIVKNSDYEGIQEHPKDVKHIRSLLKDYGGHVIVDLYDKYD